MPLKAEFSHSIHTLFCRWLCTLNTTHEEEEEGENSIERSRRKKRSYKKSNLYK
jgi:hypothetical protein